MKNKILIDTTTPEKQFEQHLNIIGNEKIIFSGIFGIGKTYFLKRFFKQHEKYNVIHLFPVNYSIATNEDIFKLIKYDILYELIVEKKYDIENDYNIINDKADFYDIYGFINYNIVFLFAYSLHFIPIIGKASSSFLEKTKKLWDKYRTKSKEIEGQDDLVKQVFDFVNKTEKHYLLENDIIVTIIDEALKKLKQIKESNIKKENILIIDDLDRIDPEHIFRLLNVFSANTDDNVNSKYKRFSFDKVIFVLDIQNVRYIFHNRYGSATDFSGYIDKFYSYEVFEFDNTTEIANSVDKILNNIKTPEKYKKIFNLQEVSFVRNLSSLVLTVLIKNNTLNLRTLLKFSYKEYPVPIYPIKFKNYVRHENSRISIIIIYDFFKSIFGSYYGLIRAIAKSRKNINIETNIIDFELFTGMLLLVEDYENHNFQKNQSKEKSYVYQCKELKLTFYYSISEYNRFINREFGGNIIKVINEQNQEIEINFKIFFHILHKTFEKINDLNKG